MTNPLGLCVDGTCGHWAGSHDIYEPGDPYPTCCVEGCRCGQPGEAIVTEHADGTVTVDHADPVILVSRELLDTAKPEFWDGETLTLDTAGEWRYQYLRPDPHDEQHVLIFGRIQPTPDTRRTR